MERRDHRAKTGGAGEDRGICGELPPQNLDARFDDFLIGHEPGIPYGGVNPELSGASARTRESSRKSTVSTSTSRDRDFRDFRNCDGCANIRYVASFYRGVSASAMGELRGMSSE